MNTKSFIKPIVLVVGVTALSGVGGYVWKEEHRPSVLEIYVFALKNGRSMFIRTPEDKRILIDGGSSSEIIREISKVLPFYSRRIDTVMVTNTEGKNVAGLIDVIERYKVDMVYVPSQTIESLGLASSTDQIYATFLDVLEEKKIVMDKLSEGRVVNLDSKVSCRIHFPAEPSVFSYSKSSLPEILFTISFSKNSFLFLGNASNKTQKYFATKISTPITADVMIVSHSALPANITKQIIEKIKPKNLVFSQRIVKQARPKEKKEIVDPLGYLDKEKRFNIKEKGTTKIVSDGSNVTLSSNGI